MYLSFCNLIWLFSFRRASWFFLSSLINSCSWFFVFFYFLTLITSVCFWDMKGNIKRSIENVTIMRWFEDSRAIFWTFNIVTFIHLFLLGNDVNSLQKTNLCGQLTFCLSSFLTLKWLLCLPRPSTWSFFSWMSCIIFWLTTNVFK